MKVYTYNKKMSIEYVFKNINDQISQLIFVCHQISGTILVKGDFLIG